MYEGDSLPQHICCNCLDDVNRYFAKIQRCKIVEQRWIEENENCHEKYVEVRKIVEVSIKLLLFFFHCI